METGLGFALKNYIRCFLWYVLMDFWGYVLKGMFFGLTRSAFLRIFHVFDDFFGLLKQSEVAKGPQLKKEALEMASF